MVNEISGSTATQLYYETLWRFRICAKEENSRNGPVLAMPGETILRLLSPRCRVLFDPIRDANPFFHVMETVWMFAGENSVEWLSQFNSNIEKYAENGVLHGAYGHRWRSHFHIDQLLTVINLLKEDKNTRRSVIGMWDPMVDLSGGLDLPCNTHIYFRVRDNKLNMTVCNRSNDAIWGALGTNVVHMTYLQEFIAQACKLELGDYVVFTNNLHIYKNMPNFGSIIATYNSDDFDQYFKTSISDRKLLSENEDPEDFLNECVAFIAGAEDKFVSPWLAEVAQPMYRAHIARKKGEDGMKYVDQIGAKDWRIACEQWIDRR